MRLSFVFYPEIGKHTIHMYVYVILSEEVGFG